jgi:hypothetical protein
MKKKKNTPTLPKDASEHKVADVSLEDAAVNPPIEATQPQKNETANAPWWKRWKYWRRLIEILGFSFAATYAIVTYLQWRDLRHNFRDQYRSFEANERSWMRVEVVWPKEIPMDGRIALKVTNVGKSPALNTITHVAIQVVNHSVPPNFQLNGFHAMIQSSAILFPGDGGEPNPVDRDNPGGGVIGISDSEKQDLESGQSYLAVFGLTFYSDQFGDHWTRFCDWKPFTNNHSLTFSASECVRFNGVGDVDRSHPRLGNRVSGP